MKRKTHPLIEKDPYLAAYESVIQRRQDHAVYTEQKITEGKRSLTEFATGHEYFGLHRTEDGWVFREWAPNATRISLIGNFTDWQQNPDLELSRINDAGHWELRVASGAIHHGDLYRLHMCWHNNEGDRIPAFARRVVQNEETKIFNAQVWQPGDPHVWMHPGIDAGGRAPLIYESHVGMAQEEGRVSTYDQFRVHTLPRVVDAGYNTIQLMAIMEHPYYGSFGYHVSSFFAASSRFGTPDELKRLIDEAHGAGIAVIIDLVHSHAVCNEVEGLSRFDGTPYQYFHSGGRGNHSAWDSRCFDYGKPEVLHFLLSNCRFWLDEYNVDGFRFDGVTSMMYHHRGLGTAFASYDNYFDGSVDDDALAYLTLANKLIHDVNPGAITIAEDVSGMPGLTARAESGGTGFDFRLAMGIPDCWFKLLRETRDDDWNMHHIWHHLTDRRPEERTISYVESHDQAIVGSKTMIFELIDAEMYGSMRVTDGSATVDRGLALHKLIRMLTMTTTCGGYLNFMGNEFGHPEWIDFPREGNNWSHHYARRQWSLRDNQDLKYRFLADFDRAIVRLVRDDCDLDHSTPRLICAHDGDKILAFERNNLIFIFNLHPSISFPDYGIEVENGDYKLVMNSDAVSFGGHGRVEDDQIYHSRRVMENRKPRNMLKVYIPSRTALVLKALGTSIRIKSRPAI